jgi:hypothetical protein
MATSPLQNEKPREDEGDADAGACVVKTSLRVTVRVSQPFSVDSFLKVTGSLPCPKTG